MTSDIRNEDEGACDVSEWDECGCDCWCHKLVCPICGDRIDLPPGPRQPNGNCVVTGPGPGGTRSDGSLIDPEDGER